MNKYLLLLGVLSLAFSAGFALRCYSCEENGCNSGNNGNEKTCTNLETHCAKVDIDDGDAIYRDCFGEDPVGSLPSSNGTLDLSSWADADKINIYICKDQDLCNGSVRLAEIFTMTIFLPICLVLVSFFSRQ